MAKLITREDLIWAGAEALMASGEQDDTEWALGDAARVLDAIWPLILERVRLIGHARGSLLRTELNALDAALNRQGMGSGLPDGGQQ